MNSYEFGTTGAGQKVEAYILENDSGIRAEFLNYGCILRQLWVPLEDGTYVNIVHGLDSVRAYEEDGCFFGAFVGRFANRIRNASFELNGTTYPLQPNDGPHHLHGLWHKVLFEAQPYPAPTLEEASRGIVFTYRSPDGEDGFPGNVDVKVTYYLGNDDVLHMDYEAVSDQDTIINLTNHSYFNLGAGQILQVNADRFLEITKEIIPTGRILSADDYPDTDLRSGKDVDRDYPELGFFDHCFILNRPEGQTHGPDAILTSPGRRICLEITTTDPAIQVYSGNNCGIALEPEQYPCAPNFPEFPSCVMKAGEKKVWKNSYRIGKI